MRSQSASFIRRLLLLRLWSVGAALKKYDLHLSAYIKSLPWVLLLSRCSRVLNGLSGFTQAMQAAYLEAEYQREVYGRCEDEDGLSMEDKTATLAAAVLMKRWLKG